MRRILIRRPASALLLQASGASAPAPEFSTRSAKCGAYALLFLFALLGCSPQTHQARSADELTDEVRVIAAAARAQMEAGDGVVCIGRVLVGNPTFDHLTTTDLAELLDHLSMATEMSTDRSVAQRRLEDAAINQGAERTGLGASCTGSTFLTFSRVQFVGDVALALADKRTLRDCSARALLFRLRRVDGAWRMIDQRHGGSTSGISCSETPRSETWSEYFLIRS